MNTQTELKNILATSEFIFDNHEIATDEYYNVELAKDVNQLSYIYDRYYMNNEYLFVVCPLGVARDFFKDFENFENFENVKNLNDNDLIMIFMPDDYINTKSDINEYLKDLKTYKKSLDNYVD